MTRTGRFDLGGLIADVFPPAEAEHAHRAVDEGPDATLGVCFDWSAT